MIVKGGGRRFGMGAKPKEVWGTGVPSGVQWRSPGKGSGGLKNFKSSYKEILRIFGSISHIITCLCFSVLAGIVPLSLRNGGHLIPSAPPLVYKWRQLLPLPHPQHCRLWFRDQDTPFLHDTPLQVDLSKNLTLQRFFNVRNYARMTIRGQYISPFRGVGIFGDESLAGEQIAAIIAHKVRLTLDKFSWRQLESNGQCISCVERRMSFQLVQCVKRFHIDIVKFTNHPLLQPSHAHSR